MRSALITSLFAVAALASPMQMVQRDVKTNTVVAVVTDVVYVLPNGNVVSTSKQPGEFFVQQTSTSSSTSSSTSTTSTTSTTPSPTSTSSSTSTPPPATTAPPKAFIQVAQSVASAAAAPVASAAAAVAAPVGNDYVSQALAAHNNARAAHQAPALSWDGGLAATAAQIAGSCVFAHSMNVNGGGYGQNIALGLPASQIYNIIWNQFYTNEIGNYPGFGNPNPPMGNFENWGHASQVIWKSTYAVGCASQVCGSLGGSTFTVCNYKGPGNVGGQYAANVLA